jgi:bacterioferritin-associated ferredoxin
MIICVCRRINDKSIERCARAGLDFDDIQMELGVATQCGKCECQARNLITECSRNQLVAHLEKNGQPPRGMVAALAG